MTHLGLIAIGIEVSVAAYAAGRTVFPKTRNARCLRNQGHTKPTETGGTGEERLELRESWPDDGIRGSGVRGRTRPHTT